MNTLARFMAQRRGIILVGKISENQVYESYRKFAIARDGFALSFEAVRPHLQSEIWGIRLWWAATSTYMAEFAFDNVNEEAKESQAFRLGCL